LLEIKKSKDIEVKVDLSGKPKLRSGEEEVELDSVEEAQYAKYMLMMNREKILIPLDKKVLENILTDMKKLDKEIKSKLKKTLNLLIKNEKVKNEIKDTVYMKIWSSLFPQ